MGRRKIEIQPITHERNRSVTFLKRKNGLFKKAYELGVLCSVDVAVIIFEERPGHQRKLYQYCSSDVQSIVQQHLRHDGERDTRGPGDFSGIASAKNDDGGDADEDDGEEDDDDIPSTKKRTRGETSSIAKLRPPHAQDNMMDADVLVIFLLFISSPLIGPILKDGL
ncbi:SRF-like protein [Tricholoma matsutake]|nr:SRF-like protein [Tricholoma matsutake 945]